MQGALLQSPGSQGPATEVMATAPPSRVTGPATAFTYSIEGAGDSLAARGTVVFLAEGVVVGLLSAVNVDEAPFPEPLLAGLVESLRRRMGE